MLLLFAVIGTVTGRGGLSNTRVEVHDLPLFQHRAAGPRPTAVVVKEGEKKIVTRGTRLRRNDGYEYGAGLSATMLCSQLAPLTSSTFLVDLNTFWRSARSSFFLYYGVLPPKRGSILIPVHCWRMFCGVQASCSTQDPREPGVMYINGRSVSHSFSILHSPTTAKCLLHRMDRMDRMLGTYGYTPSQFALLLLLFSLSPSKALVTTFRW